MHWIVNSCIMYAMPRPPLTFALSTIAYTKRVRIAPSVTPVYLPFVSLTHTSKFLSRNPLGMCIPLAASWMLLGACLLSSRSGTPPVHLPEPSSQLDAQKRSYTELCALELHPCGISFCLLLPITVFFLSGRDA